MARNKRKLQIPPNRKLKRKSQHAKASASSKFSGTSSHVVFAKEKRSFIEKNIIQKYGHVNHPLDVVDNFYAIQQHQISKNGNMNQLAKSCAEVYEWIGDAVVGELVGRCLLSQFQKYPISSRVFRNLRLGLVTNENLSFVYDHMGYHRTGMDFRKMKEKADIVESIMGELVIRMEKQKSDISACIRYRAHMDHVLSCMLRTHFKKCTEAKAGPLCLSFNPFTCLPEEELDPETGELIVREGDYNWDTLTDISCEKSSIDLIKDYKQARDEKADSHHAFDCNRLQEAQCDLHSIDLFKACRQLNNNHILLNSHEIFEVFKIYGMTVLAERISLALAHKYVFCGKNFVEEKISITPAELTRKRQAILGVENLANCSILLGICGDVHGVRDDDVLKRLQANSLRAFIGLQSAFLKHELIKMICSFLLSQAFQSHSLWPLLPERTNLQFLPHSVDTISTFMRSNICNSMHRKGERPPVEKTFQLRACDSGAVEELSASSIVANAAACSRSAEERKHKVSLNKHKREPIARHISSTLTRFLHRRFLFCLEDLLITFATGQIDICRMKMTEYQLDLEPCTGEWSKWEVHSKCLTLAMRDSFYRLLVHDLTQYHALVSSSKTLGDATRVTQIRVPFQYSWKKVTNGARVTNENDAVG
jgi:hypothetical protein